MALTKLFETFAQRYANRPGGYTRIHKFGNRPGDNAPHAILELVDSPRDLRWELTSRAVGWEILKEKLKIKSPEAIINAGAQQTLDVMKVEKDMHFKEKGILRPKTRWALQKVLKFRDKGAISDLSEKATEYVVRHPSYHYNSSERLLIGHLGRAIGYTIGFPNYSRRNACQK